MQNIKTIVFDLDGVILDSVPMVTEHLSRKYKDFSFEMQRKLLYGNFLEETAKIKHLLVPVSEEEREKMRVEYTKRKMEAKLFPGIKELLESLKKQGYVLALNTSAYERNCVPPLRNNGILDLFDFLGTAEISRSKAEKFRILKERYLGEIIFITDTVGDITEAQEEDVPTIAVTWGAHNREDFTRFSNLVGIVDTPEELYENI